MPDLTALSRQLRTLTVQMPSDEALEALTAYKRLVAGALVTLATHPEVSTAWHLVVEDLIVQHMLRTVVVGDHMQEATLFQEGKRQVVLKLLLDIQAAFDGVHASLQGGNGHAAGGD